MRILRVFPRRTAGTPTDEDTFIGDPPFPEMRPAADDIDEVHVSCTFTWDKEEARRLEEAWAECYQNVGLGGPVFECDVGIAADFTAGLYLKRGVTITSRGCPNQCPWCLVAEREGGLRELSEIAAGHEVQDNNILACSREHFRRVCEMLRAQRKPAVFSGGFEAKRLSGWHVEQLKALKIQQVFLAYDSPGAVRETSAAVTRLRAAGLTQRQVMCYVLIGYANDSPDAAEGRCAEAFGWGALPFAMLWRGPKNEGHYDREWKALQRRWGRKEIIFSRMSGWAPEKKNDTSPLFEEE